MASRFDILLLYEIHMLWIKWSIHNSLEYKLGNKQKLYLHADILVKLLRNKSN